MVLVDGHRRAGIPADDRGLQYGDGLFETLAVVDGRPALWRLHMDRLGEGCARLGIPAPCPELLSRDAARLIGPVATGVLKILITRGSGGRGYRSPAAGGSRRIVSFHRYPDHPSGHWRRGVAIRLCETRLASQPALAGLKHLNRLEQILARAEWSDPSIAEGLMLAHNGAVVEGTSTNVFIVEGTRLSTPRLDLCGVDGVMRRRIMALARGEGLSVSERTLEPEDLIRGDGVFLTNSVIGIWPVRRLGDARWRIGGAVRRLQRLLTEAGDVPAAIVEE